MPDSDKQLKIKITILADSSGAKQAAQGLAELNDQVKGNNEGNFELTEGTKKYIQKLDEQTEEEKKAIASKGEIRHGLREIGAELPILGEAGRIALDPLIGGMVLLAGSVAHALESIEQLGNRGTPEFTQLTEAIEKQHVAMEQVESDARAYQRSLEALRNANESIQDKSSSYLTNLNARGQAEIAISSKTQEREQAILEAAEQMGLITHQEFIEKKLELDEEYARKRLKIEDDLAAAAVIEKYREQYNTRTEASKLQAGMPAKVEAAKNAAGNAEFAAGRQTTDEDNLKKTLDKIQELQKEAVELHDKTTGLGRFATMEPQYVLEKKKSQNDQEMQDNMRIADQLRELIRLDKERKTSTADASSAAKEDLSRDQDRLRQDTTRLHQLDTELPRDTKQMQQGIKERHQESELDSQTRTAKAIGASAASAASNQSIITTAVSGHLDSLLSGQTGLISAMRTGAAISQRQAGDIAQLRRELENLVSSAAAHPGGH